MDLTLRESRLAHDNEMDYGKYGFEVFEVEREGHETDFKAIFNLKTDKIVAFTRKSYKLLPNEVVLDAANNMAPKLGLKQFKVVADSVKEWQTHPGSSSPYYESRKEGRTIVQSIKGDEHAILDENAMRIFAFYSLPEMRLMDKDDHMNFGILVRNSVDGTSGLRIDGFTYRDICSNISIMGMSIIAKIGRASGIRKKHTKGMDIELGALEMHIKSVKKGLEPVHKMYGEMMVEDIDRNTVNRLAKSIPAKYLPEYIEKTPRGGTLHLDPSPTKWKVYNDLTEKIWHEPTFMGTKLALFEKLHAGFL